MEHTTTEWKRIARLLKEVYAQIQTEALDKGIDILSPEYDELINKARLTILEKNGWTLDEYRKIKEQIEGIDKLGTVEMMNETKKKVEETLSTVEELKNRYIPTAEDIAEIAEAVAQKYIVPPVITNEIVKEITIEKPKIIETTKVTKEKYDDKPIRAEIEKLFEKVNSIKVPPELDEQKIKNDLFNALKLDIKKSTELMGMPDFRKLAMGLQEQIDDMRDGSFPSSFDYIQFDTSATPQTSQAGLLQWNTTDGTLDIGLLNNSILQTGQELHFYGKASGAIANGELVQFAGAEGDHILMKKVVPAEVIANPHYVIGVATQNIANGAFGYVTWFGKVNGVYTNTPANNDDANWIVGDILYFDNTTGQLTKTAPTAPEREIIVAAVIKTQTGSAENGTIIVRPTLGKKITDLEDVDGGTWDTNGQALVWNNDAGYFTRSNAFPTSSHYTGFPNTTDTSLSWNDGTYTLTLTASSKSIWIDGIEYTISTLTKALTVAQEAVTGLYWFWLTQTGGTVSLNCDINAPGFDKCLVATVYWNTTTNKGILSDERHWMGRDQKVHEYLHETVGARYASGMAGTFTDTTFQIDDGEFYDEDIEHTFGSNQTTAKVLYHNGSSAWAWDILTTPYKVVNPGVDNTLRYNNGTALASVDTAKFVNYWVFATGDTTHPIHIVIGTAQYATIALARAATIPSFGGLASAETKLIYKITFQNSGGTPDYIEATDYRSSSNLPTGNYVATDHGSLTGLTDDDHPQYALISGGRTITVSATEPTSPSVGDLWVQTS